MLLKYGRFKFELEPKDLLFLAVSGSHSYGTFRPDSDLDLRGVYIPSFKDAIKLQGGGMNTIFKSKEIADDIDIEFVPIRKWLQIILKGNGNYLENLWQEKVYPNYSDLSYHSVVGEKVRMVEELKHLIVKYGLSKKYRNHYIGFARSQRKDFGQKYKTKCLLYIYRVLMSGIVLYRDEEIEYNLHRLIKKVKIPETDTNLKFLLNNYQDEKSITTDHVKMRLDDDMDKLTEMLNMYADESALPEKPDYEPFNDWMYKYYKRELE